MQYRVIRDDLYLTELYIRGGGTSWGARWSTDAISAAVFHTIAAATAVVDYLDAAPRSARFIGAKHTIEATNDSTPVKDWK